MEGESIFYELLVNYVSVATAKYVSTCSLFMLTENIKNNTERIENQVNMLKAWYAVSVTNHIYSNWKTTPCAGQQWCFLSVFISTEEVLLFPL